MNGITSKIYFQQVAIEEAQPKSNEVRWCGIFFHVDTFAHSAAHLFVNDVSLKS